jgi:hypothetical protein
MMVQVGIKASCTIMVQVGIRQAVPSWYRSASGKLYHHGTGRHQGKLYHHGTGQYLDLRY